MRVGASGGIPETATWLPTGTSLCTTRTASAAMSDLYDTDILAWSARQAELLRRMAAGDRVNDQVDWENVAEEIEVVRGIGAEE